MYSIEHHINTKINWKNLAFAVIWWQCGKLQKKVCTLFDIVSSPILS